MVIESYKKTKPLNKELTDFIKTEVLFDLNQKQMINFVVLQLFYFNEKFYQIKKHDFSHGVYNYHKYYLSLFHRKEIPKQILSNDLFFECKKDIQKNWLNYRKKYLKKHF